MERSSCTLKDTVRTSRPPVFKTHGTYAQHSGSYTTPSDLADTLMRSFNNVTDNQPLYMEIIALREVSNTGTNRLFRSMWEYRGAWPSRYHFRAALERTLSETMSEPGLRIDLEIVPLGDIDKKTFARKLQVLAQMAELVDQTFANKSQEWEQKVERQQAKIETLEQEILKLKSSLEKRNEIESKLLQILQDHLSQAAENH